MHNIGGDGSSHTLMMHGGVLEGLVSVRKTERAFVDFKFSTRRPLASGRVGDLSSDRLACQEFEMINQHHLRAASFLN